MSLLREELQTLPSRRLLAGILWRLLLPLSITWAWQLSSRTPDTTVGPIRTFFDSIAFFLIPAFVILSAKLYLFERYTRRHRYYQLLLESPVEVSLPSISKCVAELTARICSRSLLDEARIISIESEWGNGKSRVLRELQDNFLDQSQSGSTVDEEIQTVMIMVDIWSFSNHFDLQFSLLEELLSHPLVPAPVLRRGPLTLRFWNHSVMLVPLIFLRFLLGAGKFILKTSHVDFVLQQTEGLWHPLLRNIIDKLRANNTRVVWCLDEIDRSSPEVAQQAVLLTKRFLNFPGTAIVLPYVEESMQYKVFNPLICTQPDLQSTMLQILIDKKDYFPSAQNLKDTVPEQRYIWPMPLEEKPGSEPGSVASAVTKEGNQAGPQLAVGNIVADASQIRWARDISDRLLHAVSMLRAGEFRTLANMASEKFLQQSRIDLPFPEPEDIQVLLNKTTRIMDSQCRRDLGIKQDFTSAEVRSALDEGLRDAKSRGGRRTRPGLRQFIYQSEEMIAALRRQDSFVEALKKLSSDAQRRKQLLVVLGRFCYPYSSQDAG